MGGNGICLTAVSHGFDPFCFSFFQRGQFGLVFFALFYRLCLSCQKGIQKAQAYTYCPYQDNNCENQPK